MTTHEFQELDDEELRERVLDALEKIERLRKADQPRGMVTKGDPPSGSAGEGVETLKALFGADKIEVEIGKDEKGWM